MQFSQKGAFLVLAVVLVIAAVFTVGIPSPSGPPPSSMVEHPALSNDSVRFAVIGDYGWDGTGEADVAELVHRLNPDVIITLGDNNYPLGSVSTIDRKIGKYYYDFIFPYRGSYGAGSDVNRFFPTLGNHGWGSGTISPYLEYFTLPGNERYYDFVWGPVHFFALDSEPGEPDGITSTSIQAVWLQEQLAIANETWKLVYFHRPPYSSGSIHGSAEVMRWPFQEWGATAVLSGHDHTYERLSVEGLPYFVNGIGGALRYRSGEPVPGSVFRYDGGYGAMLASADNETITFQLYDDHQELIDTYTITSSDELPVNENMMHQKMLLSFE